MKTGAVIESLEPRRLLSVTVENLQGPPPAGDPPRGPESQPLLDLTVGGDKSVWYTANIYGSSYPWLVTVNKKGRSTNNISELSEVEDIGPVAAGPGGTTYVNTSVEIDIASSGAVFIFKFGTDGNPTLFDVVSRGSNPLTDMAVAADGSVYFTFDRDNGVYRSTELSYDPTLIGTATGNVRRMLIGPDGAIWFTESGAARIGRLTTNGKLTEYKLPSGEAYDIAIGPDRALWFTEPAANKIGRVDLKGHLREYALPTAGAQPAGITGGPGDTVWFTEPGLRRLASIRTGSGKIKELALGRSMRGPKWITTGNDNRIYFSRVGGLSRVTLNPLPLATTAATAPAAVSRSLQRPTSSIFFDGIRSLTDKIFL
jgi:streptogramin lyase